MMILVYFNLLYLYPTLFGAKRYFIYTFCLILITILAAYVNAKLELFVLEIKGREISTLGTLYFIRQFTMAIRYVLTAFMLQITVDYFEQKEELKRIELEKAMTELNFLKAQVNPHFLFNTLNNLYGLIIEKSDKSAECVLKLADILKYTIGEGNQDKVLLKKELQLLENYIELEKLRTPEANVTFTKSNTNDSLQITPLLLLPFVENAFKHGLNTVSKNGFIHLQISTKEQLLNLSIENNLPPVNNTIAIQSHGIGIDNVKKRLNLLYANRHELVIERKSDSFLVNLQINLA
ncbi:MAG: histidine kinase [Saprospiraceae bacterium]|jgi:two-component system LytT family sensor kinase|nr:histidine kinase [Saprospiraceae bacterium]